MTRNLTASVLALVLFAAVATPQHAHAGNDEWSTAGKILAGVVGLSVLSQMHQDSNQHRATHRNRSTRTEYRHRSSPFRNNCRQPAVVQHETVYVSQPARPAPCITPAPYVAPARPAPRYVPDLSEGPVVVSLEDGRRLFQPRIRGAKAYMQVWSEVTSEWITIKEYPSIY